MDRLILSAIRFHARHGVRPEERALGRVFEADVEMECDTRTASGGDRLEDAVDYSAVHRVVVEVALGPPCNLIETLAERIAAAVLWRFPAASVTVRVRKMAPPGMPDVAWAGVEIVRFRE